MTNKKMAWLLTMKTGGRLVKHARFHWLLLAESHLNRRRFGDDAGADRAPAGPTG